MVPTTAPANDAAIDALGLTTSSAVLEVGFGQGRTTHRLASLDHHVIGVDPSPTMVRQARSRNRHAVRSGTVRLERSDGVHLPVDGHSADAALTVHTIYFMDQPATTFAEIARVLRPGAPLVIACVVSDDGVDPRKDAAVYRVPSVADVCDLLTAATFVDLAHRALDHPAGVHLFTGRTSL